MKHKNEPFLYLLTYIALMVAYGILYRYWPGAIGNGDSNFTLTFIKSLYFSAVTITTLGYGDITPKSELAMIFVASEVILGIVIIGLFLSSLWQSFVDKQETIFTAKIEEQESQRLQSYYKYLKTIISEFKTVLAELTTPIAERDKDLEPQQDFAFSNLKDMYNFSLVINNGFSKPVIHHYFDKLDLLSSELKFMLSNFDFHKHPTIQDNIITFLSLSRGDNDVREALYSYETLKQNDTPLKDSLSKMIAESKTCPKVDDVRANLITPAIILYETLQNQMKELKQLEDKFASIH